MERWSRRKPRNSGGEGDGCRGACRVRPGLGRQNATDARTLPGPSRRRAGQRPLAGADRARRRGPARPAARKKRPPSCCPRLHTFQEVLEEIVRVNDPAARPLTAVQRRLLAEDLVADLTDGGRLPHFAGVADTRGFTDGVLGLLTDLQRNAIPPDAFAEKSAGVGAKERQCARLYAHYHDELRRQNLHDADGVAGRACDLLRRACGGRSPRSAPCSWTASATSPVRNMSFSNCCASGSRNCGSRCPAKTTTGGADLFARPRETLERLRRCGRKWNGLASRGRQPPDGGCNRRNHVSGRTPRPGSPRRPGPSGTPAVPAPPRRRAIRRRDRRRPHRGARRPRRGPARRPAHQDAAAGRDRPRRHSGRPPRRVPVCRRARRGLRRIRLAGGNGGHGAVDAQPGGGAAAAGGAAARRRLAVRRRDGPAAQHLLPSAVAGGADGAGHAAAGRGAAASAGRAARPRRLPVGRCSAGRSSSSRAWKTNRPRNRGGGAPTNWPRSAASSCTASSRRGTTPPPRRRSPNTSPGCAASPRTWA